VSLIAIALAALSLTLDFGTIEAGVAAGAPKYMEWYCGFGLMVTLIWLYITLLRLLALNAGHMEAPSRARCHQALSQNSFRLSARCLCA